MKLKLSLIIFIFLVIQPIIVLSQLDIENQQSCYSWAIVGAGLAGITALAVLMDCGVDPASIVWIDPEFNVGRLGKYYRNVPGNLQTGSFLVYVNTCPYFKNVNSTFLDSLQMCDPNEFPPLRVIVDPLADFTTYLRNKVVAITNVITSLNQIDNYWVLEGSDCIINAQKVILAIGAHPRKLNYDLPEIPLDDALDQSKLTSQVSPTDCVAVFGSMHSAILLLKYLSECSVKQIINFYIDPYFYGSPGLEGNTALWAKNVLEQNPPANLIRVLNTPENREKLFPQCTKAIYAIGFEQNPILVNGTFTLEFDEGTGIIDQNLYGIGIAFPATGICNGQKIAKNGVHAYLGYAKNLIPQWIANDKSYAQSMREQEELPWM
jgi:hypothetical protein